jgi:nucleoside 2-deoxyribosyltransferase
MPSKVYLAGPIAGLMYGEATDWREHARSRLSQFGIIGLSPMRGKEFLASVAGPLTADEDAHSSLGPIYTSRGIMTQDRWDATRCDVMLVNLLGAKTVSIGTMMELAWADLSRIPTVVAMEPGNIHQHPMVAEAIDFRHATLDGAIQNVLAMLP